MTDRIPPRFIAAPAESDEHLQAIEYARGAEWYAKNGNLTLAINRLRFASFWLGLGLDRGVREYPAARRAVDRAERAIEAALQRRPK